MLNNKAYYYIDRPPSIDVLNQAIGENDNIFTDGEGSRQSYKKQVMINETTDEKEDPQYCSLDTWPLRDSNSISHFSNNHKELVEGDDTTTPRSLEYDFHEVSQCEDFENNFWKNYGGNFPSNIP